MLLYDGKKITVLHPTLSGLYVTTLAGTESDLWVGTLDRGVLHWHAGETESFGEAQGLPDPQVQSIAISGDKTYVGTVLGVAEFDRGRFSRTLAAGVLATALLPSRRPTAGWVRRSGRDRDPAGGTAPQFPPGRSRQNSPKSTSCSSEGEAVFALTRSGLYRMGAHGFGWQPVLQPGRGDIE